MRRGQAGYTLVELMTVITIISLLAILAVSRLSGWTSSEDARKFAREVTQQIFAARSRALNLSQTYEVHLKLASVQWVRKDSGGVIREYGPLIQPPGNQSSVAGSKPLGIAGVTATGFATVSDANTSTFINTAIQHAPQKVFTASDDWVISIDGTGIIDGNVLNNTTNPPPIDAVTIFIDGPRKMRIIVYPLAGQPQIMENW